MTADADGADHVLAGIQEAMRLGNPDQGRMVIGYLCIASYAREDGVDGWWFDFHEGQQIPMSLGLTRMLQLNLDRQFSKLLARDDEDDE